MAVMELAAINACPEGLDRQETLNYNPAGFNEWPGETRRLKIDLGSWLTLTFGDTKLESCARRKRNRLPNAVNSYWGCGSHTSAVAWRKWPLWCLLAVEYFSAVSR